MSDELQDQPNIPPPTFEFLILSLKMQAEVGLGLIQLPGDEEGKDLNRARHFIDLLAMLEEKTKGNLSLNEQRLLENSVTELRFRYVQVSQSATND
jgi:hypothetical protein